MRKLPKIVKKGKKRLGRGFGSGKGGHTVGRGMKGQKSRNNLGVMFEGLKMKKSFIKRLPFLRGKGKFKPDPNPIVVDLKDLNVIRAGTLVDVDTLIKNEIVKEKEALKRGVKILANGKVEKKLKVKLPVSKGAAKAIEEAGGEVLS